MYCHFVKSSLSTLVALRTTVSALLQLSVSYTVIDEKVITQSNRFSKFFLCHISKEMYETIAKIFSFPKCVTTLPCVIRMLKITAEFSPINESIS